MYKERVLTFLLINVRGTLKDTSVFYGLQGFRIGSSLNCKQTNGALLPPKMTLLPRD